jgi:hypothetical protein
MIRKPLAEILESDLIALVDNEVAEGRTIEYKRDLPADSREGRSEFMSDVLSFANSSGGDLIFGIAESSGIPVELIGVDVADPDAIGLRFENICRDNIEPRIHPLQCKALGLANGRSIVIVRVARSWQAPHRNRQSGTFPSRNSRGKYPMDVAELRAAFLTSANLEQRVRQFREGRASVIGSDLAPRLLKPGIAVCLHLVPVESMLGERRLDLNASSDLLYKFRPMGNISGYNVGVNLDGALAYTSSDTAYTQLFRAGQVEAVFVYPDRAGHERALYGEFEVHVRVAASTYLDELRALEFTGPVALMLSVYRAEGSHLSIGSMSVFAPLALRAAVLHTPEVVVQEKSELENQLTSLFEIVWNAYGQIRPEGWQPRR